MKVAIITGASKGLGACVAEALAEDGYSLALIARNKTALAELQAKIERASAGKTSVICLTTDVSQHDQVKGSVAEVVSRWGRIDLLFNNAGIFGDVKLESPVENFDREIGINLNGAFYMLKEVVPQMKRQGAGHIINVASRAGKIAFSGTPGYSASKFGLVGLNESLYRELCPLGIKVTALCPSWLPTDMGRAAPIPDEEKIQLEDMVKTVRYLASLSAPTCVKEITIECRKAIY